MQSVESPVTRISFNGRVLFLSADPDVMDAQLAGHDIDLAEAGALRDDISTDEITPLPTLLNFDERLGLDAHTGYKAGDRYPIAKGLLQSGGFKVLVAGNRYGKGSSREHSPLAEYSAGIRLVIARSFERLYRQNCDNIGLITSTDFSLIDRIKAGEAIEMAELTAGRDRLAAAILAEGGLLAYGRKHIKGVSVGSAIDDGRPRTLVEKIMARHALRIDGSDWDMAPGTGGFVRPDFRFIHEFYTGMAAHMLHAAFGEPLGSS